MKNLKNLGKALNKNEQKQINGGAPDGERSCSTSDDCPYYECCASGSCISWSRPACDLAGI